MWVHYIVIRHSNYIFFVFKHTFANFTIASDERKGRARLGCLESWAQRSHWLAKMLRERGTAVVIFLKRFINAMHNLQTSKNTN